MKRIKKKHFAAAAVILLTIFASGCSTAVYRAGSGEEIIDGVLLPIAQGLKDVGGGKMKSGSFEWLVYPMGWLMKGLSYVVGNIYALMILLATVLIRTIAWPIYGKTNDMSLKMQLLAPEQAKIQAKYADKTDKESQQRMSMEMMQLFKKYKVSFSGCLMPFVQMPIFLAFYETLRRIPYSSSSFWDKYGKNVTDKNGTIKEFTYKKLIIDSDNLKNNLFGIDLMKTSSEYGWNEWGRWGIYLIALLVAVTQIGMQIISQKRTKKQKKELEGNIPAYRRTEPTNEQKQSEMMMKIMTYSMPIVMVVFIIQSPAALGWYWLVGNIFTAFQTLISSKKSVKKMQKLREKYAAKSFAVK